MLLYSADCPSEADVLFILDSSSSLGPKRFYDLFTASKMLAVNLYSSKIRIALETFADDPVLVFDFTDDVAKLAQLDALHVPYIGGTTDTAKALRYV